MPDVCGKDGKPADTGPASRPVRQRAVTLLDIAGALGVSRATVSLVLRGSPLVSDATRARVQAELKRQNYVYNRAAANLRQRTSSSVALIINDLSNPFFAEFAAGVDEALGECGYVTLLGSTGESVARQQAVLGSLMEHSPSGFIISPAEDSDERQLRQVLHGQSRVLLFNRELDGSDWDFLALDNREGAMQATTHLLQQGHRRIAFFGGHGQSSSCRQRHEGYAQAMREAGLVLRPEWRVETMPARLDAVAHAGDLLACHEPPTAAVCYNDTVALGLMLGLASRGIKVGQDFAVTGFDDIAEAAVASPPLTTLVTDPRARGRQAAALLLERNRHPDAAPCRVVAPARLCVRQSSATPLESSSTRKTQA